MGKIVVVHFFFVRYISRESSAGRRFSCNIKPYFCRKLGKMTQNLSSAAVVIGALRVE